MGPMLGLRWNWADLLAYLGRFKAAEEMKPPPVIEDPADPATDHEWVNLTERKRTKSRGKSKGHRPWSQITGITLHQTAVDFGTDPERLLNVPVHGATLSDGTIVRLHKPTDYMYHGNGFNRRDIGIEVSARACGIEGDVRTLWLPSKYKDLSNTERLEKAVEATDVQLEATRQLIRYYVELVAENGGKIEFIHAHRQSHSSRVSDPGSRIWKACGEWAREELGLKVGPPDFRIGDGNPLPDAWTGRPNGQRYNWQIDGRIQPSDIDTAS